MKATFNYLLLFFLCTAGLSAQNYKISKINKEDFAEKRYAKDTTASAVIEYSICNTYFVNTVDGFNLITETKNRIKILTKDGYDYATVKVPLYRNRSVDEKFFVSDAYTYNLEGNEIVKTKLSSSSKIEEKLNEHHRVATFTMPNVKEGSIIEYTTKITSPYFTNISEWFFQQQIPVIYSEYKITIPEVLIFYRYLKGANYISNTISGNSYFFKAVDLPAMKDEGYVSNIDNYRASVSHNFSGYVQQDGSTKIVSGSWETVANTLNEEKKFGKQLSNIEFCKAIATELIKGKTSTQEQVNAITDYVRENFSWNKKIGYFATDDIKDVFKSKSGSTAELNLLTIALLRNAKIKAHPVIVSTRDKGISFMPSIDAYNNIIIGVEEANVISLHDVTDKMTSRNILPIYNLNSIGRLIRTNGSSTDVSLEPSVTSTFNVNTFLNLNPENGSVSGNVRINCDNYEAYLYRKAYENQSEDKIANMLEDKYGMEIDSLNIVNRAQKNERLQQYYKFTKNNCFDRIGDKIYINPTFVFGMNQNRFKAEERQYPIDFLYPNQNSYSVTINIPEGFVVDYVPSNKSIVSSQKSVGVKWLISYDDKRIRIKWNVDYNKTTAAVSEYQDIKGVLEELTKFTNEKIVLKKI